MKVGLIHSSQYLKIQEKIPSKTEDGSEGTKEKCLLRKTYSIKIHLLTVCSSKNWSRVFLWAKAKRSTNDSH